MSRLIDADELLTAFPADDEPLVTKSCIRMTIQHMPTIDLVTCDECKYKRLYDGETKYYYCALEIRPNRNWSVDDRNYCCWGERESE